MRRRSGSRGTLFVSSDQLEERLSELRESLVEASSPPALQSLKVNVDAEVAKMRDTCLSVARASVSQFVASSSDKLAVHAAELEGLQRQVEERLEELHKVGLQVAREKEAFDAHLKRHPTQQVFARYVRLRVGEHVFHTSVNTLRAVPESMLGVMFSGKFQLEADEEGCYFVDRDGHLFHHLLSWLRSREMPEASTPRATLEGLVRECVFFGLAPMRVALEERLSRGEELYETTSMANIKEMASVHYVQSIISTLAELTHMVFKQMARDAGNGHAWTKMAFSRADPEYEFLVAVEDDLARPSKACQIFLELLRKEEVPIECALLDSSIQFTCYLLKTDDEICQAVLKNFRKMRSVQPPGGER